MGAAAELHRHPGHIDDTHHIGIFLAEHRHSTSRLGLIDRHLLHLEAVSLSDPTVDQGLDLSQLLRGDRTRAMEVEAESIEVHQRTGLTDAWIHHLLEGGLQQMGRRVIRLGMTTTGAVHLSMDGVPQRQLTAFESAGMNKHVTRATHRLDRHDQISTAEDAAIPHLTATLPVEGRGVQHDLHRISGGGRRGRLAVHHQGLHAAGVLQHRIAPKCRGLLVRCHLLDRILEGEIKAHGCGLGSLPLFLHGGLESRKVHREPMLLGDLLGELQREAIGVVKLEGLSAADLHRLSSQHLRQQLLAALEGFQEAGLLPAQLREDHLLPVDHAGVSALQQVNRRFPHRHQKRFVDAQQTSMAHHAAQQTAQDVAAAQVAGGDAIADQLGDGTAVIADHLQRRLALVVELVVVDPRQISGRLDQRKDQIGFVVVGNLLQDLGHPLEAHAGVDVAVGQRREVALGVAVVLHEHQVVELDKTVVVLEIDAVIPQLGLEVVVDLRARATGASGARGPEVVGFIHADDPFGIHPHHIPPDLFGFVVLPEHTHHQIPGINAIHLGAEFPGPLNRLLLEVIPKREVAEHLKKCVMPSRAAHVLDVVGADALLRTGGSRRGSLLLAQKNRLERQHSRNGEQHRWVVGNQRSAGHPLVAALGIEVQESLTDLLSAAGRRRCRRRRCGGGHGRKWGSSGHDRLRAAGTLACPAR